MGQNSIIIVGAGIAGLTAAKEIRTNSQDAQIILISREDALPYYRLSLTRYLAGEVEKKTLPVYPAEWYEKNAIQLLLGCEVTAIDRQGKSVTLSDGRSLAYDRLILTTGARPSVPPIPGTDSSGVLTLRTMTDADQLLERLNHTRACIAIGGGLLGLETAGAIAHHGVGVTLLEVAPWLMPRQLNQTAAAILKSQVERAGISVREGVGIAQIVGKDKCEGVQLNSGEFIPGEFVMITAGVTPEIRLAKEAGLKTNRGVVVDQFMRTSDEAIYAAGDMAEYSEAPAGLWNTAQQQGRIAGLNAIGQGTPWQIAPKTHNLKVLGLDVFSMGQIQSSDKLLEKVDGEKYYGFTLQEGRVISGIVLGDRAFSTKVKQAIDKGRVFPQDAWDDVNALISHIAG